MLKPLIIFTLIIIATLLVVPHILAQDIGISGTLNTITGQAGYKTVQGETFIDTLVGEIITLVLGFVGALFLGIIVFAGFQWMSAGGNEEVVSKAKKKVTSSVIGLGIVTLAFVISNAVFTFFYAQSGRQAGSTAITCDSNDNCQSDEICVNDYCVPTPVCFGSGAGQCPPGYSCPVPGGQQCIRD